MPKNPKNWKTQLIVTKGFINSIDNDEERVMHSKSDSIDIIIYKEAAEVIKAVFD